MPKNLKGRDIAEIIPDKCIGCELCLAECPVDSAIIMESGVAKSTRRSASGCGKCFDVCPSGAVIFEKPRKKKKAEKEAPPLDGYQGVAVFIEIRDGRGAEVAWKLIGKARELAEKLDTQVLGFLLGTGIEPVAEEAIAYGCDAVYMIDNPLLQVYLPKIYGKALVHLSNQTKPELQSLTLDCALTNIETVWM